MDNSNDEKVVLDTIKQIIKEVKQEMKQKKVLTESKTPQQIFKNREKDLNNYIVENVMNTLDKAIKQ